MRHIIGVRRNQVDLIDHRDDLQVGFQRQVQVRQRLSLDALRGIVGRVLRFIRISTGRQGFLVHFFGARLRGLDSGLGALIDVLDVARILRRHVVQFIGLVDQRRGLLAAVILG